jgi:hypothetical protein
MDEPVEVITLEGFDPEGEPEIRVMDNGSLELVFNFMPPTWAEENPEAFDDFDVQLSEVLDLEVLWEDREFFVIEEPSDDTVERIKQFLEHYRDE